jgi:hypothetical protein
MLSMLMIHTLSDMVLIVFGHFAGSDPLSSTTITTIYPLHCLPPVSSTIHCHHPQLITSYHHRSPPASTSHYK